VIVLVAGLAVGRAILAGSSSNGLPPSGVGHRTTPRHPLPPQKINQKNNAIGPAPTYPPAQSFGLAIARSTGSRPASVWTSRLTADERGER
jgi:hypothetical protein